MSASLHHPRYRDGAIRLLSEADDIVVLALEGDLDRHDAPTLGEQLDRALETRKALVLDLSEVTFIDSSIINELFRAGHAAKDGGQTAVLQLGTAPLVDRILAIVGIESVLPRAHDRDEALRTIERGAARVVEHRAPNG